MKVTKAVMLCGGRGTRLLPITKAVPKELLPIIDRPSVSYIAQELADSGITDLLIILGDGKQSIRQYFDADPALADFLSGQGNDTAAQAIKDVSYGLNIRYKIQMQPKGSADALMLAQDFCGSDPFVLALGDDIMVANPPVTKQLADAFALSQRSAVAVQTVTDDSICSYGVVVPDLDFSFARLWDKNQKTATDLAKKADFDILNRISACKGFIEKPPLNALPSRMAVMGRYLLTTEIFGAMQTLTPVAGELRLTDALNTLAKADRMCVYDFVGDRYDSGSRLGRLKAEIELSLKREYSVNVKDYLIDLENRLSIK